jgi:hypothetical protein
MSLTYEGKPVRYTVLFPRNPENFVAQLGSLFVGFREPLGIEDALLRQKWIRAAVDSKRLGLVVDRRRKGRVAGLLSYSALPAEQPRARYAPHETLLPLQALLGSTDTAMTVSPHGDLYVLVGTGVVFQKSQGMWRYVNYDGIHWALSKLLGEDLTTALLRMALDLSFERTGALITVLDRDDDVATLIPDHRDAKRPNRTLRESLAGLSIMNWEARQVIAGAASIDGATVLSRSGHILDIACLVAPPLPEVLRAATGSETSKTFEGARTTAAWNASVFGTSLKVSEDGPITVFRHGEQIARIGASA